MALLFQLYIYPIKREKIPNNILHSYVGSLISPLYILFSFQNTRGYHADIYLHHPFPLPHLLKILSYQKDISTHSYLAELFIDFLQMNHFPR